MREMFCYCSSLTSLNLSNFNTNNVKDMKNIFLNLNKNCKIIYNDKKIKKMILNNQVSFIKIYGKKYS